MRTEFEPVDGRKPFRKSGNPGYLRGRPVLARNSNSSANATSRYLQLSHAGGPPVLFGVNTFNSGRITRQIDNRTEWCATWRHWVMEQLWGADISQWRIAAFGNSPLEGKFISSIIRRHPSIKCRFQSK